MYSQPAASTFALKSLLCLLLLTGALSARLYNAAGAQCRPGGFCSCTAKSKGLWSKYDVQSNVGALAVSPGMLCSPRSAYALAYQAMTAERDSARCSPQDPMRPPSAQATVFNDALADLMTRYFVAIANGTAPGADVDNLWADLYKDGEAGNFNALHMAMASTAIYLTSHMGLALSALPHAEELWEGSSFTTIGQRVDHLQSEFKPTYDAFNSFLASHIDTVGRALTDAKYVGGQTCEITVILVAHGSGPLSTMFEDIRSRTFELAMKIALETEIGTHPLTQTRYDGKHVLATSMDIPGTLIPQYGSYYVSLAKHARFWRRWLGDALGPIYRHASGAMNYKELANGTEQHANCLKAASQM